MRFDRIRLSNFKCYADANLRLDRGVTVIHGLNGSGKSSLLEACFFALYGAKALDKTLEDVVTIGEDDAEIELWFTHSGSSYHLERHVRATGNRAQTAKCVLETPTGTVDGARNVRQRVAELLRMDSEAFVNCAYVRQGEVNKLINAQPSTRQDMIDDLLQLGTLEEYRERAKDGRLGVKSVLDDKRGNLSGLTDQIEEKSDKDLHGRLNALETELNEVEDEIENYETQQSNAENALEAASETLENYEEKRDELESLNEEITELQTEINETESDRETLRERIGEAKTAISELNSQIESLLAETALETDATPEQVETQIAEIEADDEEIRETLEETRRTVQMFENQEENLRERADEHEQRAERKREDAAELAEAVEQDEADLADRESTLDELDEKIQTLRDAFDDEPVAFGEAADYRDSLESELDDLRETETEVKATLETARKSVEEAEALLEEGKCPECGQPVDGSPHLDSIEEDRERVSTVEAELESIHEEKEELVEQLADARNLVERETEIAELENNQENVEELLTEKRQRLAEKREQVEELETEATELAETATENREVATEKADEAATHREEVESLEEKRETFADRRERLEQIQSLEADVAEKEDEIERHGERRETLDELNDQRRDRLSEKRERKSTLEAEYDEGQIEQAQEEKSRAKQYLEDVTGKIDALQERRDELQNDIGAVKNEIEELENLQELQRKLSEKVEALETLYGEAEQLEAMYGTLRAELRQRNVESLERMLNEVFDLVYQNDSYSRIELDGEYKLTVYQKDGEQLDPEQLSGGERALFNLSLRCAIYRLLSEGIEGTAPMPPLILDEPTVFLDSGHVSQLVELVESMRQLGVEQIVVVSHDEELVGAADDLVTVVKDSTSNRSRVERGEQPLELPAD